MSKSSVQKKIRRLKRSHRAAINEATEYLVHEIKNRDLEARALRGDLMAAEADRRRLRCELVGTAMRLAMAQGYFSAAIAAARGEAVVAMPTFEIEGIAPAVW